MNLKNSVIRQIQSLVQAITSTCRAIGIHEKSYLPIGGKYPNEMLLKCEIDGRHFGVLIYNPCRSWGVSVHIVEELRHRKKHGCYFYRSVTYHHMFFLDGRIEPAEECWEWGVSCTDGYDLRMYGFGEYIAEYLMQYPPECDATDDRLFGSIKDALQYYAAWESQEERTVRIGRSHAFNK